MQRKKKKVGGVVSRIEIIKSDICQLSKTFSVPTELELGIDSGE